MLQKEFKYIYRLVFIKSIGGLIMDRYTSVSPAEVGLVSGITGAAVGYTLAPRKYNLEQLLTQQPDVFEKSINTKLLAKSDKVHKTAFQKLKDARKTISEALKNNTAERKLAELLQSPELKDSYKNIKGFLPKARLQTAIILAAIGAVIGTLGSVMCGNKQA